MSGFLSSVGLPDVSLYAETTFGLSTYPSMDTWLAVLAIMNKAAVIMGAHMSVWVTAFGSLCVYLEVELLDHVIILSLIFGEPQRFFSQSFICSLARYKYSSFSTSSPTLTSFHFPGVILMGIRWSLVALICVSLMTSAADRLSMSLLAACVSPLEKCLLKSLAYFWIALFVA